MKFIPSNQVSLDHSLRVSSNQSPRQILRVGTDRYVVIDMTNAKMVTAFESVKFSQLINTLKQPIEDVEVIATRPLLSRDHTSGTGVASNETTFEIRMFLARGEGLAFNSTETAFAFCEPAPTIVEECSTAAADHWVLPDQHPFSSLLVTPDFIDWVNRLTANCDSKQVLERCFIDFRRQYNSAIVYPGKHLTVDGEFGDFIGIEYLCGRVCFHSAT